MGLLGTGTQSRNLAGSGHCAGHKEWSCKWEKPFHGILGHCQQQPLSVGAWLTLQPHWGSGSATLGCATMCLGIARASTGRGGHSSGMAEEAAWPQQAQKEWEEEGLHMGEDAETTPGALV